MEQNEAEIKAKTLSQCSEVLVEIADELARSSKNLENYCANSSPEEVVGYVMGRLAQKNADAMSNLRSILIGISNSRLRIAVGQERDGILKSKQQDKLTRHAIADEIVQSTETVNAAVAHRIVMNCRGGLAHLEEGEGNA